MRSCFEALSVAENHQRGSSWQRSRGSIYATRKIPRPFGSIAPVCATWIREGKLFPDKKVAIIQDILEWKPLDLSIRWTRLCAPHLKSWLSSLLTPKSHHGASVRLIHRMPLTIMRWSSLGCPIFGWRGGSKGCTRSRYRLVKSLLIWPAHANLQTCPSFKNGSPTIPLGEPQALVKTQYLSFWDEFGQTKWFIVIWSSGKISPGSNSGS